MRNLGLNGRRATTELAELVNPDFAVRVGQRRHSRYLLEPIALAPNTRAVVDLLAQRENLVLDALRGHDDLSRRDIQKATQLPQITVLRA